MPETPAAWTTPPPGRSEPAVPPAAQAPPSSDPGQGGTTSGGLTRRVRGAQMPSTEPLLLHRGPGSGSGEHAAVGGSGLGGHRDPLAPESKRAADDVYSFLSNFTAGVQRGLREAPRPNGRHER
jgi:hypothetical protein